MFMRARRRRTLIFSAVALGVAFTSGAVVWLSTAGANTDSEPAAFAQKGAFKSKVVSKLAAESSHSSVRGKELKGGRGQIKGKSIAIGGGDGVAAFSGSFTPVAVESSDGRFVVYSSWRRFTEPQAGVTNQGETGRALGIPKVRIYDTVEGQDKLIEAGAYSPALSREGLLAFVRGDSDVLRLDAEYTGRIVVGRVDGKSFKPWTSEAAKYFPYAWAGSTLLAYKVFPYSEVADLYAFTGPGQGRLLAPEALVIAISPDASRVLVTVSRRTVGVIRVADGAIEASMPLDGEGVADDESSTTPHALGYSGSWYGDRVAAASDMGLVVLNVKDGIRIESVINPSEFARNIYDPTLLDDAHLIGWVNLDRGATTETESGTPAQEEYDNALVECDLSEMSCDIGSRTHMSIWQRWVRNPSR